MSLPLIVINTGSLFFAVQGISAIPSAATDTNIFSYCVLDVVEATFYGWRIGGLL